MCLTCLLIAVVLFVADADQCQWGKFGQNCERNCSCNCALVKNNTAKHCNKTSGECSEGCLPGWCGTDCKKTCSVNCLNQICNQHNGYCTLGCQENYTGPLCYIAKDFSNPDACKCDSSETYLAVALGVLALLNVIGAVVWCVRFIRRRPTYTKKPNKNPVLEALRPQPGIELEDVPTT
ncbi:multiple epidermal growth factor-like domains protein 11 isoform X1 [Haliotis cracherodii]|uniref:multiple epidermal growth factor-like domains protein 11 isoform X1 n=1 Tax=Haliotis cracherodii TaxID=6455 RepID=UPI0039EC51AC